LPIYLPDARTKGQTGRNTEYRGVSRAIDRREKQVGAGGSVGGLTPLNWGIKKTRKKITRQGSWGIDA